MFSLTDVRWVKTLSQKFLLHNITSIIQQNKYVITQRHALRSSQHFKYVNSQCVLWGSECIMFSKLSKSMVYIWGIFLSDTQEQKRDSLWSTHKDAWYCAYSGLLPRRLWITTPSIWVWGWASLFQVTANTVQLKTITKVKNLNTWPVSE